MCKFGCSNPVLLAGTGPGQFLSEKGRPTSTSSVQSISAWQQRWEKWDTYGTHMGFHMGQYGQVTLNADFNGKYESKYVELCEHM